MGTPPHASWHRSCKALTAADVQRDAAAQIVESEDTAYRSTRLLAGIGNSGASPGNMKKDLHRLLRRECPLPVVACLFQEVTDESGHV